MSGFAIGLLIVIGLIAFNRRGAAKDAESAAEKKSRELERDASRRVTIRRSRTPGITDLWHVDLAAMRLSFTSIVDADKYVRHYDLRRVSPGLWEERVDIVATRGEIAARIRFFERVGDQHGAGMARDEMNEEMTSTWEPVAPDVRGDIEEAFLKCERLRA